jgi:hypothetical protein
MIFTPEKRLELGKVRGAAKMTGGATLFGIAVELSSRPCFD